MRQGAELFRREAANQAPVDTGYLKGHITITNASATKATIESQADYSGFVEFGTFKMSAQPYFRPAIESTSDEIGNILMRALTK